jgi:hypothetical protein
LKLFQNNVGRRRFAVLSGFGAFLNTLSVIKKTLKQILLLLCFIFCVIYPCTEIYGQDTTISDTSSVKNGIISTADSTTAPKDTITAEEKEPVLRLRKELHNFPSYYIYVFFAGFIILALITLVDPYYLQELFLSAFKTSHLFTLLQEGRFGLNFVNLLLDSIFILMFSILIQVEFFPDKPSLFIWIAVFSLGFFFLKIILIQIAAYIFFDKTDALLHVLMNLLFSRLMAIILLPLMFCTLYQASFPLTLLAELIIGFLLFMYIIWLLKLLVKMKIEGISGVFYLFLYLCAIEISPVLILIKDFIL